MNHSVLLVSDDDAACRQIVTILSDCGSPVVRIRSFRDLEHACRERPVAVIVSDVEMGVGTWRSVLAFTRRLPRPPYLIVIARLASENLWLDLLDEGVFDLFAKAALDGDLRRAVMNSLKDWNRLR